MAAPAYLMLTAPLLMGSLFSFFFFGAFFIQLFVYVTEFAKTDSRKFIGLVSFVSVAELLHLIFTTHTIYNMLALGYGDTNSLSNAPWSGSALPALNGIVSLCTQLFFAWRIRVLGKNIISLAGAVVIALLALTQCAASFAVSVQVNGLGIEVESEKKLYQTAIVWLGGTVACNLLMTVFLVVVLMYFKRTTAMQASSRKSIIDTVITHTVENGALITICAALNLIFFLVYPNNYMYIGVELILGRLYSNALMATLNHRDRRGITGTFSEMRDKESTSLSLNQGAVPLANFRSLRTQGRNNNPNHKKTHHGRISQVPNVNLYPIVSITTEVQVHGDDKGAHYDKDSESFQNNEEKAQVSLTFGSLAAPHSQ